MSTAIIKFENDPELMFYCKSDSYPAGLGFDLLNIRDSNENYFQFLNSERFEKVDTIPLDIQYEYIIKKNNDIHCQESWYAKDVSYHGGGIRHGGTYDLREWKKKIDLQQKYSYRLPEHWK